MSPTHVFQAGVSFHVAPPKMSSNLPDQTNALTLRYRRPYGAAWNPRRGRKYGNIWKLINN